MSKPVIFLLCEFYNNINGYELGWFSHDDDHIRKLKSYIYTTKGSIIRDIISSDLIYYFDFCILFYNRKIDIDKVIINDIIPAFKYLPFHNNIKYFIVGNVLRYYTIININNSVSNICTLLHAECSKLDIIESSNIVFLSLPEHLYSSYIIEIQLSLISQKLKLKPPRRNLYLSLFFDDRATCISELRTFPSIIKNTLGEDITHIFLKPGW